MDTGIRVDSRLSTAGSPQTLQAWKAGQLIKALVIDGTPPGSGGGRAILRIAGNDYAVRSQTPLTQGDTVQLEVKRTAPEPLLQLRPASTGEPLPTTAATKPLPQPAANALETSVKTLLSQQTTLSAGLQTLATKLPELDPPTARLLQNLLQSLPTPQTLTQAESLRSALTHAGNHLEAALQLNRTPSPTDFKLQLATTLQALPANTPPSIRNTLEAMTARISLNQLHSTGGAQAQQNIQWLVEIPMRTPEGYRTIRFEIERRTNTPGAPADISPDWNVRVQLDLPRLGPLEARVSSIGGSVSARFWADRARTVARIEHELPTLAAAWRERGLRPGTLNAFHGSAPTPSDPGTHSETDSRLVDVRT